MKELILKVNRTIRYLFYRQLNITEQNEISEIIDNNDLLSLYWNMSKADRQHSYEVFKRTNKNTSEKELLLLALFHDIGKSKIHAGLLFRVLSDLGVIKTKKSQIYLNHEIIGLKILEEKNINDEIINFYKNNLLKQKNIILDKTDF